MGHERRYDTFDCKYTPQRITDAVMDIIAHNGDRYGSQSIKFLNEICDNYDEAQELLDKRAQGQFYPAFAVKFRERTHERSAAVQAATDKLNKLTKERSEYMTKHSIHERKSEFIGCPHCGSKVANARFKGEYCPVCRGDLRSQTVQEKIKAYDAKMNKASADITTAYNKNKVIGTKWLVMYEYHI